MDLVIDVTGEDRYESSNFSQGMGHLLGPASRWITVETTSIAAPATVMAPRPMSVSVVYSWIANGGGI